MTSYNCWIEEYETKQGLGARFVDKESKKKIVLFTTEPDKKQKLIMFLSNNKVLFPETLKCDGEDFIFVEGNFIKESEKEIFLDYDDDLSYIVK